MFENHVAFLLLSMGTRETIRTQINNNMIELMTAICKCACTTKRKMPAKRRFLCLIAQLS